MTNLLSIENLIVDFPNGSRILNNVSLSLRQGEILGLVGESGSGKSLLARTLVRLESPARIISGSVLLDGEEVTAKNQKDMQKLRGRKISLALQNPRSAMDPVFTMGSQFREVVLSRDDLKKRKIKADIFSGIYKFLQAVGIASPETRCRQYPHEWSRGMLQRAQVAMTFSTFPKLLILDEVTSALDPTITLQMLDIIVRLKEERNTGIILITHDIAVASEVCDRIAVMQKGHIVETGAVRDVLDTPSHPYTNLLVSSVREAVC